MPYTQWKTSLINCFLNRAYIVSNTWSVFHDEVAKLTEVFKDNGYPQKVFDNCVSKFLDKKRLVVENHQDDNQTNNIVIFCIPYIGHPSRNFKRVMSKISKRINLETRIVFQTFRVGNYFSLKDRTPLELKANVVALVTRAFPT